MKGKKAVRVVLDVAMTVMIVLEMFIQFTGEFLHEVIGFAFFATVVAHLALSATWVKKTAHATQAGTLTARRAALAVMGCLLAATMVVLGVSSVAISSILSSAGFTWTVGSYALWADVHTVSAYALCALVVVHLAMHWAFLAAAFRVPYNPARRRAIGSGVNAVAALGVIALGATVAGKTLPQTAEAAGQHGIAPNEEGSDAAVGGQGAEGSPDAAANGQGANGSTDAAANGQGAEGADRSSAQPGTGKRSGKHGFGRDDGRRGSRSTGEPADGSFGSRSGKPADGSSGQPSDNASGEAPDGSSGSASDGSNDESRGSASDSASESSSGSSSNGAGDAAATGICTLCRKQCPLSAPKCNKPYEAGLL